MKLRLFIFLFALAYGTLQAQQVPLNEKWDVIGGTVTSKIVSSWNVGHPEINLNYEYDDDPVSGGGGARRNPLQ